MRIKELVHECSEQIYLFIVAKNWELPKCPLVGE